MIWRTDIKNLRLRLLEGAAQTLPKGEVIQSSADEKEISLVMRGYVKRYFISHDGCLGVQAVYGTGDVFPLSAALSAIFEQNNTYQEPEIYYYEAMTRVSLFTLKTAKLLEQIQADPLLYPDLLRDAGIRLHSNTQFLENLRLHGAYRKTAHQLSYFGYRFGRAVPDGIRIGLPLTHQDIADMIGTTRETVTASIIKLRDKQLIKDRHFILVRDINRLTQEAYS